MFITQWDEVDNRQCRFVLRPNCSLSWRATMWIYGWIALVSLIVAVLCALSGAWPVLPFAVLELIALGVALYITCLRTNRCEVISVGPQTVAVEKGHYQPEQRWDFPRSWVQVALTRSRARFHPSRLALSAYGREVELGSFLNDGERESLAGELRRALAGATPA